MFEGALILLEKMYFGIFILFLLYVVLKKRTKAFVPGAVLSLLFSFAFAWAAEYSKSDRWVRNGTLFEGTTSYIIALTGWVCFLLLFVIFGATRSFYRYYALGERTNKVFQETVLWCCFGLTLFDLQAQYFHSEARLGVVGVLSSLYILVYAVPHVIRACERYRRKSTIK